MILLLFSSLRHNWVRSLLFTVPPRSYQRPLLSPLSIARCFSGLRLLFSIHVVPFDLNSRIFRAYQQVWRLYGVRSPWWSISTENVSVNLTDEHLLIQRLSLWVILECFEEASWGSLPRWLHLWVLFPYCQGWWVDLHSDHVWFGFFYSHTPTGTGIHMKVLLKDLSLPKICNRAHEMREGSVDSVFIGRSRLTTRWRRVLHLKM